MLFRRFRPSDRDRVWALHAADVSGSGGEAPDSYFAELREIHATFIAAGGEFVVAELEHEIVAMGGLRPTLADRAELKATRVHPRFQRRGLGARLLRHLEQRAIELGFRVVHLDTTVSQHGARHFYTENGYVQAGAGVKAGYDVILFEKHLNPSRGSCLS